MNVTYKKLKEDGVVLTKDFFNEDDISKVDKISTGFESIIKFLKSMRGVEDEYLPTFKFF